MAEGIKQCCPLLDKRRHTQHARVIRREMQRKDECVDNSGKAGVVLAPLVYISGGTEAVGDERPALELDKAPCCAWHEVCLKLAHGNSDPQKAIYRHLQTVTEHCETSLHMSA